MGKTAYLDESQAQAVFLVRSFEEADPDGRWLKTEARRRATTAALAKQPDLSATTTAARVVADRAERLLPDLDALAPMLPGVRRVTRLGAGLGTALALGAFALGLLSNALGPLRHVNLLSLPLLGALTWNLFVYVAFASVWLLRGRKTQPGNGLGRLLAPLLTLGYLRRAASRLRAEAPEKASLVGRATSSFLSAWRAVSAPLVAARGRRLLHLGALFLVLGMIGGMYARGLIFEYRATWESTFLDAAGVHRLFSLVFTPASALLHQPIPTTEALESMRAPEAGPAAPWIHLYAMTALLVVGIPRTLLFTADSLRVARLRRRLPIDTHGAYFRRILAAGRGERLRVEMLPYSYDPAPRVLDGLQTALLDLYGSRSNLRRHEAVDYGGDPPAADSVDDGARTATVLFNLAQTPEAEVHGDFLEQVEGQLVSEGEPLLVVIDQSRYRERLGSDEEGRRRLEERQRAWERIVRGPGRAIAQVDLETLSAADVHKVLNTALEEEAEARC
ncbi:MAG: DUF2868 domain-containing protein [Acidobacteria bacterium]|nr:DUF2868 domain-containing protein [Acidobacteriota bacterium]